MKIIGHRGAKGIAKENTLAGIKAAIKAGVDAVELDVRLHNNNLILAHDQPNSNTEYCLLSDALFLIDAQLPIILDIKENIAQTIYEATQHADNNLIYSSRHFSVLRHLYQLDSSLELAVIEPWSAVRASVRANKIKSKRLHMKHTWLWNGVVRWLNQRGFAVYCYTVNSPARAKKLDDWGVKGIFTDHPDRF